MEIKLVEIKLKTKNRSYLRKTKTSDFPRDCISIVDLTQVYYLLAALYQ